MFSLLSHMVPAWPVNGVAHVSAAAGYLDKTTVGHVAERLDRLSSVDSARLHAVGDLGSEVPAGVLAHPEPDSGR
ncbi:hypothetical protein [Stenotrophomonas maltophilia]|uniref:hypothetical protein n=1 Tax=Stenotrophomonas maltophilia TaxID=40324 RepID=UPI0015C53A09|nr:hypothetical protein [Stenotrophomonas maltophilia]